MRKFLAVAALGLMVSGVGLAPAVAQDAERAAAVAACSGDSADAAACEVAIAAFIAAVEGLPAVTADDLLAGLVLELAASATPATAALASDAILAVSTAFTEPARAAAAAEIAGDVATGTPTDTDTTDALASPT